MFSQEATKIDEIFTIDWKPTTYLSNVKSMVKILSNFVAFLKVR